MKIGILSDTHGRDDRLEAALRLLRQRGAQTIVHCGDLETPSSLELLGKCGAPAYLVAGNMDRLSPDLKELAKKAGVIFHEETVEVPLGDGRFLVALHGHREHVLAELLAGGQFPYICHGHTHKTRDDRIGPVRIINAGALSNCRGPHYPTMALLDTHGDELEFLRLPAEHA